MENFNFREFLVENGWEKNPEVFGDFYTKSNFKSFQKLIELHFTENLIKCETYGGSIIFERRMPPKSKNEAERFLNFFNID